jgi:uncharacterized integral membrane protein
MGTMTASPTPATSRPNPAVGAARTGLWFVRLWGLALIVVGLWFFASDTLGYDLPAISWDLVWPVGLIALGAAIIGSALANRR